MWLTKILPPNIEWVSIAMPMACLGCPSPYGRCYFHNVNIYISIDSVLNMILPLLRLFHIPKTAHTRAGVWVLERGFSNQALPINKVNLIDEWYYKRGYRGSRKNTSSLRLCEGFRWAYCVIHFQKHQNWLPSYSTHPFAFSGKRFWFPSCRVQIQASSSLLIIPKPYRNSCRRHAHAINLISHQWMLGCQNTSSSVSVTCQWKFYKNYKGWPICVS